MDWVGNLWMHLCSDHCLVMLIKRKSESESFSVTFNLSLNLEVVKFICFHSLVTMTEWEPTNRSLLWGTYFTKMENEGKCVACYKVLQCKGGNTVEPQIRSSASHCPSLTRNAYFTLFSREKRVKFEMLSLFPRVKSEMKMPWNRDREWKVKWKCLEIEIEKWNRKKILENSRETRLSQVTVVSSVKLHVPDLPLSFAQLATFLRPICHFPSPNLPLPFSAFFNCISLRIIFHIYFLCQTACARFATFLRPICHRKLPMAVFCPIAYNLAFAAEKVAAAAEQETVLCMSYSGMQCHIVKWLWSCFWSGISGCISRTAFQMEGEVDNEVTAVIMQRRAIFEQEYIQLRQTHPSLPAQLRDFQVSCIPAHLRPEKKTLVRCLI